MRRFFDDLNPVTYSIATSIASTRLPRAFGHFMSLKTPLRALSYHGLLDIG